MIFLALAQLVQEQPSYFTELKNDLPVHATAPVVPFFSQFTDIASPSWKKVGCGVTSLAMIIEYYRPGIISVDSLLEEGIEAGAYLNDAGWTYAGLIGVSKKYGFVGESYVLGDLTKERAFAEFKKHLTEGPVIASVHYEFDPKSTIPHLVVINGIEGDVVYYNDPAAKGGNKTISTKKFLAAWKKRFIVVRRDESSPIAFSQLFGN